MASPLDIDTFPTVLQGRGSISRWQGAQLDESFRAPDPFRRDARIPPPAPDPDSGENIEQLCWGAEASNTQSRTGWEIKIQSFSNTSQPALDETSQQQKTLTYTEVSRVTSVIRVENPDDSFQYVDVERIEEIVFRGEDGIDRKFILNHG